MTVISIRMQGEDYEQDVRPLIKAFYPDGELQIQHTEETEWETPPEKSEVRLILRLEPSRFFLSGSVEKTVFSATEDFRCLLEGVYQNDGVPDRRMYRNYLHRSLYEILHRMTGKELPWGTLTGIRPTKQILERLEEGESEESIAKYFKTEYLCSDEKISLALAVAEKEQRLLTGMMDGDSYSLYLGVPFCPSICLYCSFSSYPYDTFKKYVRPYLAALEREIAFAATCFPGKKLVSIYFGGGTPTTLSAEQLRGIIHKIKRSFDLRYLREWTVEAGRPDSITMEKLRMLKEEGITRISINPQTMQQKTLDLIGRKHTTGQIKEAYQMARECGFDNINMDLIVGLTGEGVPEITDTLKKLEPLAPDSITVHTLAVKRAARLNKEKERYQELRSTEAEAMLAVCSGFMKQHGYEPYYLYRQKNMADNLENVGYARPGREGLYNILIMEERHTILAIGTGASSKFVFQGTNRIDRIENVKSVKDYTERVDEMIARKQEFLRQYGEQL